MAKLTAFLSLNTANFQAGLKNATNAIGAFKNASGGTSSVLGEIGSGAAKAFAGVAGIASAAFGGVAVAAKSVMDEAGSISDMMAQTGASGRNLVILSQALKNVGIESAKIPSFLGKMQKTLVSASEGSEDAVASFKKLGLNVSDLVGLDAVDAFRRISDAIAGLPNPTTRAAAAMSIFGKSGGELMAFISDSSAWTSAAELAGSYADVIGENAARFDAVSDSIGNMGIVLKQVGAIAAEAMLPQMEKMLEMLPDLVRGIGLFDWRNPFSTDLTDKDREAANRLAEQWAKDDPGYMRSAKEDAQASLERKNAAFWAGKEAEKQEAIAKAAEKARMEAEKKAETERKKREETAESRAEALEAYKLEAKIVMARITGDKPALEALEREKSIRERMAGLVQAGFSPEEARKGATLMVDKTAEAEKAEKAEKVRKSAVGVNAEQLGGFAQSMNVLFGRSANNGLLDENKRQTSFLQKIYDNTKPSKDVKPNLEAVFA